LGKLPERVYIPSADTKKKERGQHFFSMKKEEARWPLTDDVLVLVLVLSSATGHSLNDTNQYDCFARMLRAKQNKKNKKE
jgi:hypothetical protein